MHLRINLVPTEPDSVPWIAEDGVTVFAPFEAGIDYFEAYRVFMLNFRVADLDAMLAQLRAAEIAVSHETAIERLGQFARIHLPEGNPVELWEPAAPPG